jgi:hypothetical protein
MLSLHDPIHRRSFLTIGTLGLGGLSLGSMFAARAASTDSRNLLTGKSVIFLFQQGGPSQFETFDPKLAVPDTIRTVTDVVQTRLPGVAFGSTMSRLANLADKFAVVRSFQTNNGAHNIHPIVSPDSLNANIGSLYSRVAGATRPQTGMPTNVVLFPDTVDKAVTKGTARGDISATGSLGGGCAPFIPGVGELQKNMTLRLPRDRFEDRRYLLAEFDRLNRDVDSAGRMDSQDEVRRQAYQLLLSGNVANAFDLTKEDDRTVARYDTGRFVRSDNWEKARRGKAGFYSGHSKSIGKLLLLARRLCEAGCGYVTIHCGYDGVWDMHADGENLDMKDGMEAIGTSFDHAVAAFIEDVEARGLSDKIMLVCTGEMGRTPKLNKNGGRDHWARLAPLLIYGGGVPGGKIVGQSTSDGGEPATEPFNPKHLISSILHTVVDPSVLRLMPGTTELARLADHPTIAGLF